MLAENPKLVNQITPLVWNNEQIKAALSADLEKYKNLIVTDDNLKDMEKVRRDIVTYRTQIEKFKKAGRDKFRQPMESFSRQCDELLAIVAEVEEPIAHQLYEYEQHRQEEVAKKIRGAYLAECDRAGVRAEFRNLIQKPNWTNRTQKWADTMADVKANVDRNLNDQQQFDSNQELEALRRAVLAEYAKTKSEKAGLSVPVDLNDIHSPVEKLLLEEGKERIDQLIEYRAVQEAKIKQAQETENKRRESEAQEAREAIQAMEELHVTEPPKAEAMRVIVTFKIQGDEDGVLLNGMLERIPARMIEDVHTEVM